MPSLRFSLFPLILPDLSAVNLSSQFSLFTFCSFGSSSFSFPQSSIHPFIHPSMHLFIHSSNVNWAPMLCQSIGAWLMAVPQTGGECIHHTQLNFHEEPLRPVLSLKHTQRQTNPYINQQPSLWKKSLKAKQKRKRKRKRKKQKTKNLDCHGSQTPPAGNFRDYIL